MKTPLTVGVLAQTLTNYEWTQEVLAERSQLHRSVISMHLSRQRPVLSMHLSAYLRPLEHDDRRDLLAAWLRDMLPADIAQDLLGAGQRDVRKDVKHWAPDVTREQQDALEWWAKCLPVDKELEDLFYKLSRRLGWQPGPEHER